jgi:hypothetical protein
MLKLRSSYSDNCSLLLDVSDRYSNLKDSWDSLMEVASHGNPRSFQVAVTVVLEQLKREELRRKKQGIKGMKHTFASFSRPSAFHPLVILSSWVVK